MCLLSFFPLGLVILFLLFANKGAGLLTFKKQYSFHFHILSVSIHFAVLVKVVGNHLRTNTVVIRCVHETVLVLHIKLALQPLHDHTLIGLL